MASDQNGFSEWGGYMAAKITKLEEQFSVASNPFRQTNLFSGISIYVNGLTNPSADELKRIMMVHGGTFHHYERSHTTFIIASNLPDVKVRNMNTSNIISPQWVLDCLKEQRIVDYSRYLLYTNQKTSQPQLNFKMKNDEVTNKSNQHSVSESKPNCDKTLKPDNLLNNVEEECDNNCVSDIENHHENARQDENPRCEDNDDSVDGTRKTKFIDELANDEELAIIRKDLEKLNDQIRVCLFKTDSVSATTTTSTTTTIAKTAPAPSTAKPIVDARPSTSSNTSVARTAVDPRFLSEFFNNSRLHHIATLGAGFKEYVSELRDKQFSSESIGFPQRQVIKAKLLEQGIPSLSDDELKIESCIMHIDMDCFFVSVGLRKHPELRGKPVAVTHSKGGASGKDVPERKNVNRELEKELLAKRFGQELRNNVLADKVRSGFDPKMSLSEIASCSYEARAKGVHNGMFVGQAMKLCPDLQTIPYDFEGYKEVAFTLYNTIASYTLQIEAVSCDEMYVDLMDIIKEIHMPPMDFVRAVRNEVKMQTGCPCSAGVGTNKLQARMATKRAKPDGQFDLLSTNILNYMAEIPIDDLPGVGWSNSHSLKEAGFTTCGDLQQASLPKIQMHVGRKLGETLYQYCRGIDKRPLVCEQVRKSVSVEVNYGIRFNEYSKLETFLHQLCEELHARLCKVQRKTKCVTLKVMVRAKEAPLEASKFMGHGVCENITKSVSLSQYTDDLETIKRTVLSTMKALNLPPNELRGLGIHVSKLNDPSSGRDQKENVIRNMFMKAAEKKKVKDANMPAAEESQADDQKAQVDSETVNSDGMNLEVSKVKKSSKLEDLFAKASEKNKENENKTIQETSTNVHVIDDNSSCSITSIGAASQDKKIKKPKEKETKKNGVKKTKKQNLRNVDIKNMLQNLPVKKPTVNNAKDSTGLPKPMDIDLEVLAELPLQMQETIIKEYGLNVKLSELQQMIESKKKIQNETLPELDTKPSTSKAAKENLASFETKRSIETRKENDTEEEESNLNSLHNQNIFLQSNSKELLSAWIQSSDEPQQCDIDLIRENASYLVRHSVDGNVKNVDYINSLYVNLVHLTRILNNLWFEKQEDFSKTIHGSQCSWHLAYKQIIESVQNQMRHHYNNEILYLGIKLACVKCHAL